MVTSIVVLSSQIYILLRIRHLNNKKPSYVTKCVISKRENTVVGRQGRHFNVE
jgi:hypothetical protein